jgi:hypothetical protein
MARRHVMAGAYDKGSYLPQGKQETKGKRKR